MAPYDSADFTHIIEQEGAEFVVYRSPDTAEQKPRYTEVSRHATEADASAFAERLIGTSDAEMAALSTS